MLIFNQNLRTFKKWLKIKAKLLTKTKTKNMLTLPKSVINYLKGLMCIFENANCMSLSRITKCSHDSLTRILSGQKFCWQTLLQNFAMRIFGKLQDGFLIIDDTIISKRFAKKIEAIAWVFDSKIKKTILGLDLVLITWSNGKVNIPLAIKVYQKKNGKTRIDLAIELLEYAHFLGIKPKYVAFDSWYSANKVLKTVIGFGWKFVTQVKRNRKINGVTAVKLHHHPYWIDQGKLTGDINVSIVRNGKKYFVTNDLSLSKKEILFCYNTRWAIEEIFRMAHSTLGIDQCESRKLITQISHFHLCMMAYILLEKERFITKQSIYEIKRNCRFNFQVADNILDKRFFKGA